MATLFSKFQNNKNTETESEIVETISRSIKHPEWLSVRLKNGQMSPGPDQSWYGGADKKLDSERKRVHVYEERN